jgi:hypothetical protein
MSTGISTIHRIRRAFGIDRAVAFTVLARTWSSLAGLVTVALISKFLTPEAQGYYYTFVSLVALQLVFELGFSVVILQLASHECAHLTITEGGVVEGDSRAHARLASVFQKAFRWYSMAAVLLVSVLIPAGLYFFSRHRPPGPGVKYGLPWTLVAVAAALTFQLDPILSFLEGCGYVARVAQLRFFQAMLGSLMAWTALLLHHGLFAPAMMILGQAIVGFAWIAGKKRFLLGLLRWNCGEARIRWFEEVWPFQWRIAVSWISGYFVFQIFTPALFAFRGPVEAGQMGMSLSIAGALTAICISWVNTKAAPFGALIAQKRYAELDQLFFRSLYQSLAFCLVGGVCVWVGVLYLNMAGIFYAKRMLEPVSLGILLLTAVVNHTWFAQAVYIRAHKQEKYLYISLALAILLTLSTFTFGRVYGARGMVTGYLFISLVVGLGFGMRVFFKYRRLWHTVKDHDCRIHA